MAKTKTQGAAEVAAIGYQVASPIEHDGVLYTVGSTIELDAETAAPLVARGILLVQAAE